MPVVDDSACARFEAQGYLHLRGLLDPSVDLAPLQAEYEDLLDAVARRLHAAGEVHSPHDRLAFAERYAYFGAKLPPISEQSYH